MLLDHQVAGITCGIDITVVEQRPHDTGFASDGTGIVQLANNHSTQITLFVFAGSWAFFRANSLWPTIKFNIISIKHQRQ